MTFHHPHLAEACVASAMDAIRRDLERLIAEADAAGHAAAPDAAAARATHARRALGDAIEHGIALLDALDEPAMDREDADPAEDGCDREPSLGAPERHPSALCDRHVDYGPFVDRSCHQSQVLWAQGSRSDREADVVDEPHDEETDDDLNHLGEGGEEDPEPSLGAPEWDGADDNWSRAGATFAVDHEA